MSSEQLWWGAAAGMSLLKNVSWIKPFLDAFAAPLVSSILTAFMSNNDFRHYHRAALVGEPVITTFLILSAAFIANAALVLDMIFNNPRLRSVRV